MVGSITSFSRSGLQDFIIQRVTAIIMMGYFFFLLWFFGSHSPLTFEVWHGLVHQTAFKVFTMLTLLSLLAHTWIGIWTVLTDYVKSPKVRFLSMMTVILLLLAYTFWGFLIVLHL